MLALILLVAQIAVVAFAVYTGRRRLKAMINDAQNHTEELVKEDLPEVDKSILKLLAERQGVVYQSEIMKVLGLPKSTVHKALRRLSEAGYVEIQKRGRLNVVVLKRPTSEASTT
ncbi:helix-turn-helix transcriptional regulator [Pyrobaculum calidifontis]|uniref:Transcriptional regulator, TrmB n=1 Tax=Pyrobaculum calidifontis (strain DSM 21063 / JCM 11548 / VA1) TaxID=410359 RepID=A3MXW8_PYRCJ|nr:helix-turn-helix domain-containing protein [Pyrobaculum calidifontis]ABO09485.1 transcriptional regulator, TrmB [Pyrobaculum calidifontis JCM 11548]